MLRLLPLFLLCLLWAPPAPPALEAPESYRARFVQLRSQPFLKRPFESRGRLFFWAEQGVLWQLEEPLERTLLITGEGVHQFEAGQKKPLLPGQAGRRLVAGLLLPLFSGQFAALERRFDLTRQGPPEAVQIDAVPKDETLRNYLARLQVKLDAQGRVIWVKLQETKGGATEIRFSRFEPAAGPVPDERARFEAPLPKAVP